jgi:putative zinc finger protein
MTCDQIEELLSDLLDDELAAGARAGVESHLASCGRCAASYKKLRRTVRFVRANSAGNFAPGTNGALYAGFTRALVDEDFKTQQRILRDEVFGDVGATGGSPGDVVATGGSPGDVGATGGSPGDVGATGGSPGEGGQS